MTAIPFYRFLEVGVYSLLNLVPYLLLPFIPSADISVSPPLLPTC